MKSIRVETNYTINDRVVKKCREFEGITIYTGTSDDGCEAVSVVNSEGIVVAVIYGTDLSVQDF
jgi:hypothetical protein